MPDLCAIWAESLQHAFALAKGDRLNELHGRYASRNDGQGLHPYSLMWGRVRLAEELEPVLSEEGVATHPVELRKAAREQAEAEFRAEILAAAA